MLRGLLKEQYEAGDEPALRVSYNKTFDLTLEQASQMNEIGRLSVLPVRVTQFVNTYLARDTESLTPQIRNLGRRLVREAVMLRTAGHRKKDTWQAPFPALRTLLIHMGSP